MICQNLKRHPLILLLLIAISIYGSMMVTLATTGYGAGLSSDAIRIISTGQNFIEGRGLITSSGTPLIFAPPYYSILLGVLSVVFHSDVFSVGMILNIFTFCAIILLSGLLFLTAMPSRPWGAIAASLVVATSPSLIRICANVAPDPLFILWVILFLLFAAWYMRNPGRRTLLVMFIPALLAASQRYLGLAVVCAAAGLIFWQNRRRLLQGTVLAAVFSLAASLPTLAFIIFHNYLGYGTLTGPRFDPQPAGNLRIALEKLIHWFIPGTITNQTGIWVWVTLGLLLLTVIMVIAWKRGLLKDTSRLVSVLPSSLFLFVYGLTLIFMLSYKEHRPLLWDRIHIVILVPLLMILADILILGFKTIKLPRGRWIELISWIVFIAWLVYPIGSTVKYIQESIQMGEASLYNIHNTGAIRNSQLAQYLEHYPFPNESNLISNYNETAWFLTRHQVEGVPTTNNSADWPELAGTTYLIWFDLPGLDYMPKSMLSLKDITERAELDLLYSGADGAVYQLFPR